MDFYILLGIERGASPDEIKRAYRRLARKYHPDINPGDRMAASHFRQIAEAYETLSDPDRRQQYDRAGTPGASGDDGTFGFEGFDFSVSVSGPSAPTFGDLFADVLRQRTRTSPGRAPERGADLHHAITLGFEEAMRGSQRQMAVTRSVHCHACRGAGRQQAAETRCQHCHGTGAVKSTRGHMIFSKPCPFCAGAGHQQDARCLVCGGQRTETRTELITVTIPPGVADGAHVRVAGRGHAGRDGGDVGDLYLLVHVQPHPFFSRDGDDLHVMVPVAVHEAALGAKVDVPALDGRARLRLPPGTQSGQRFRLRERGVPSSRTGRRGDLVVEVRLVLPKALDERSKELLREFGRLNDEDVRRELMPPVEDA
jgi:molecular chaperone DnaJ